MIVICISMQTPDSWKHYSPLINMEHNHYLNAPTQTKLPLENSSPF